MAGVKTNVAFKSFDYIITNDQLRTSFEFNKIYQDYYIDQLHPNCYYFLNDIKKFNFDYNTTTIQLSDRIKPSRS
jgi:hypothetical protein